VSGNQTERSIHFPMASRLAEVRPAVQRVREFLSSHGYGEEVLMDCDLALVEACNNAIEHAAMNVGGQSVIVEAICGSNEVELRVTDHTTGFDWPGEAALPDSESESGRGLFLIRALMDSAEYLRSPRGNMLILRKKIGNGS
jgi:serine/threonine-protein kinase RsbW